MKNILLLLLLPIGLAFGQVSVQPGSVRKQALPTSCTAGISQAILFKSGAADATYVCDDTGHYVLQPGSSTSVLTGAVGGPAGANAINGGSAGVVVAGAGGTSTSPLGYTPQNSASANTNNDALGAAAAAQSAAQAFAQNGSNIISGTIAAARVATLNQNTTGQAGTALALAATPTPCSGGQVAAGVLANGNSTGCVTAATVPLAGVATSNGTSIGSVTVSGDGTLNPSTGALLVSHSATATAAAVTPTLCPGGQAPTGVTASFNATGCAVFGTANVPATGPTVSVGGSLANGARAVQTSGSGLTVLADLPSIVDYGATSSSHYRVGGITTTSGSPNISANLTLWNSGEVGNQIVIEIVGTSSTFQSTILTFTDSTHVVLSAPVPFSTTAANGSTYFGVDNTTAIDAAFTAVKGTNLCLHIPAGQYFYNGVGLNAWAQPCIYGDGMNNSKVFLGVGKYLVDDAGFWNSSSFQNFQTVGGGGAIRNRFTGQNVAGQQIATGIQCTDFTGSCISDNSSDLPYLYWSYNVFQALNDSNNTMGIAHAGSDKGTIMGNACLITQYCIKLGIGGIGVGVFNNDFIQFRGTNSSYSRAGLWVVPATVANDGSAGLFLDWNKFGNENLKQVDQRILFADTTASSTGVYFGDTPPLTTPSTGTIEGFRMTATNRFTGGATGSGSGEPPMVYSYTPNIRKDSIAGTLSGTNPTYVLKFDAGVTVVDDYTTANNQFGPFPGYLNYSGNGAMLISNSSGFGMTLDPSGDMAISDQSVVTPFLAGSMTGGFTNKLTTQINNFTIASAAFGTKAAITDSTGITSNAATVTAGSSGIDIHATLSNPTAGQLNWVYFEARQGTGGTPISQFTASILNSAGSQVLLQKVIPGLQTTNWHPYWIPYAARTAVTAPVLSFTSSAGTGSTIDIGNVHFYQSATPVGGSQVLGVEKINDSVNPILALNNPSGSTRLASIDWFAGSTFLWTLRSDSSSANIQNLCAIDEVNTRYGWCVESDGSFNVGPSNSTTAGAFRVTTAGLVTHPSAQGTGTATFAPQTGAGSGATAVCATSHLCDSFSGEVTLTSGTVPAIGSDLIITLPITRTNQPNCAVELKGGTLFLGDTKTTTTSTITISTGAALAAATAYTINYVCGGN